MPKLTIKNVQPEDIERIFSKIAIAPLTGCWNWTAALNTYGYGCIWWHGRQEMAHRLMYAWTYGPIPQGVSGSIPNIDHLCNNPRCCNPAHLRLVKPFDNVARTNAVSAVNARKTHCIHGHPLPDKPNRKGGYGRYCPVCRAATSRAAYMRRKNGPMHEHDLTVKREAARRQRNAAQ